MKTLHKKIKLELVSSYRDYWLVTENTCSPSTVTLIIRKPFPKTSYSHRSVVTPPSCLQEVKLKFKRAISRVLPTLHPLTQEVGFNYSQSPQFSPCITLLARIPRWINVHCCGSTRVQFMRNQVSFSEAPFCSLAGQAAAAWYVHNKDRF